MRRPFTVRALIRLQPDQRRGLLASWWIILAAVEEESGRGGLGSSRRAVGTLGKGESNGGKTGVFDAPAASGALDDAWTVAVAAE